MLTLQSDCKSWHHSSHLTLIEVGSSSSQPIPERQMSCSSTRLWMVKQASSPSGSNTAITVLRACRLVMDFPGRLIFAAGGWTRSVSVAVSQRKPSIRSTAWACSTSRSTVVVLALSASGTGTDARTAGEFFFFFFFFYNDHSSQAKTKKCIVGA